MRKKRKWVLIAAVLLVLGLGYTGYALFAHSETDFLTVSEAKLQAESPQQLRVKGRVAPGSIAWDNKAQTMSFALTDNRASLPVVYHGIVPENFKPGAEVTVDGQYHPDGAFEVRSFGSGRSLCNICH